jgi:hypothetical protein
MKHEKTEIKWVVVFNIINAKLNGAKSKGG